MEQLPYYTLVPAEVALYVNVQMSTMSCVCRCARIMQMHIPMIAEVKVFQRKTCFKCVADHNTWKHENTIHNKKNQGSFGKHYGIPPAATKSKKLFLASRWSQGHKVIDLGVIWKDIISGVCMPNMKSLSLMVQKL